MHTMKVLALAGLLLWPGAARTAELETTHLFGFTLGTDVNDVGENEAELENTGHFGKQAGTYAAVSSEIGVKLSRCIISRSSPKSARLSRHFRRTGAR